MSLMMNERDLREFLRERFPEVGDKFEIVKLTDPGIDVRLKVQEQDLRPGGTVSGPSIFALGRRFGLLGPVVTHRSQGIGRDNELFDQFHEKATKD